MTQYTAEEKREELEAAEQLISDAVDRILSVLKDMNLSGSDKRRAFSPDGLGTLCRMINRGEGFEPAFFDNALTIQDMIDLVEDDEEDDEEEDEDSDEDESEEYTNSGRD